MQALNRKHPGGNIILKIDIVKAYDRVDRRFLNLVLFQLLRQSLQINC